MSRLFIELYLDEDVDVLVADLVRARGFEVVTTQQAGQIGASDEEQLSYAVTQQKTLLTHNGSTLKRSLSNTSRPEEHTKASSLPCAVLPTNLECAS